ncbi:MAG: dipeptidase [Akkermansia sp.]|nr:dipeptidase [Akkermansia sp.]
MSKIDDLFAFLSIPSVSAVAEYAKDVERCADFLVEKLGSLGFDAKKHLTDIHPIVVAHSPKVEGAPTVLIYGHYDVMPVDPISEWKSDPFKPEIRDGRVYARGASDDKGEIMAHILGAQEVIQEDGKLPLNVIYLLEGEEERGSESLFKFIRTPEAQKDLACDVIVVSDTGMAAPDIPSFSYGLKGLCCFELEVSAPAMDLHSGIFGGAVANPITTLCEMIATTHDENNHVAVEGFYDGVHEIEQWERESWRRVPGMSDAELAELTGVPQLRTETGFTGAECVYARPTFELNGISGGYEGEGSKTVIPTHAFAKMSCRLVPGQDPEAVMDKVEAHFKKVCPPSVRMKFTRQHAGDAYLSDPNSAFGKAAQKAQEMTFGNAPVLVREGGSIPIIAEVSKVLGKDALFLGLDLPDARIHSPNENMRVEIFEKGIEMAKNMLRLMADAK